MNDLLIPRFEVIANYPNSKYNIGDILFRIEYETEDWYDNGSVNNFTIHQKEIEKHTHLFKKLEWWEKRTENEMPQYLKVHSDGSVAKIKKWDMESMCGIENEEYWCDLRLWKHSPEQYQPATKQEYSDYVNSL